MVLMELTKVDNLREEATKLARDLVDFDVAPSPWNSVVRNTLARKTAVQPSSSSELEKEAAQRDTSQTLQQLADLAASVEGTVPVNSEVPTTAQTEAPPQIQEQATTPIPASADETNVENLKEELLDGIKGLDEATQLPPPPPAAPPTEEPTIHNNNDNNTSFPELQPVEQKPLDPQAILRSGYLTLFDAMDEQPQPQQPQSTPIPS